MRKLFILLFTFILVSCTITKTARTIDNEYLRGKVMSITSVVYFSKEDPIYQQKNWSERYKDRTTYDRRGNPIKHSSYSFNDTLIYEYTSVFDGSGNEIERVYKHTDDNVFNRILFKRDNKTKIITKEYYKVDNTLFDKTTIKYEKTSLYEKTFTYDINNRYLGQQVIRYGKIGNIIEIESIDTDNVTVTCVVHFNYDDRNNLIDMVIDTMGDGDQESYTYENFDKMGNWVVRKTYDKEGYSYMIEDRIIQYY